MKKHGCILATAVAVLYKFIQLAFNLVVKGLSSVLLATGLIVPCCYFLFGVVLNALFGFSISDGGTNSTLYKIGLWISIGVAGVILIYNVFVRPVRRVSRSKNAKHKLDGSEPEPELHDSREERYPPRQSLPVSYAGTLPSPGYEARDRLMQGKEVPLIYRSRTHPDIIVYEYSDRFNLYREVEGRLVRVRVQYKD